MKRKTFLVSYVLFCFLTALSHLYGQEKKEWGGKIDLENGIKIINNPKAPLYADIIYKLEEDLIIGNENDENYLFHKIRDVDVDQDGNIYVVDLGNRRVQVFSKNGIYIRTLGRFGQGPGEFELPHTINIDEDRGNIIVADRSRRRKNLCPTKSNQR